MFGEELVFVVGALSLILLPIIFTFWALVDVLKNEFSGHNKVIWVAVILLVSPVGALLYFFVGRQQKVANQPQ